MKDPQFRIRGDVRVRRVADEGIAVQQTTGEIVAVNEVGSLILDSLGSGAGKSELMGTLKAYFDVNEAELATDLDDYLEELLNASVIESIQP